MLSFELDPPFDQALELPVPVPELDSDLYRLLALYRWVKPRAKGARTGRFAAHVPRHISIMTQNVGLNTCSTSGVWACGGALYPKVNRPIGYEMERNISRRIPARVDLMEKMVC